MFLRILLLLGLPLAGLAQNDKPLLLVLSENGGHHLAFTQAAIPWIQKLAKDSGYNVLVLQHTDSIDATLLGKTKLFLQLDYPPYGWKPAAVAAFEQYLQNPSKSWIGLHHASLLGEFDGYAIWPDFWRFMGQIRFKDYIADFARGEVVVENAGHPVMRGVPNRFWIDQEEWYTYDASSRSHVQVLANVNENSYVSTKKMGDHPVIWTNPSYALRNVYIFMGHSPKLLQNPAYTRLLTNAISWGMRH